MYTPASVATVTMVYFPVNVNLPCLPRRDCKHATSGLVFRYGIHNLANRNGRVASEREFYVQRISSARGCYAFPYGGAGLDRVASGADAAAGRHARARASHGSGQD